MHTVTDDPSVTVKESMFMMCGYVEQLNVKYQFIGLL